MPTDPVCGMFVPEETDLKAVIDGQTYYFCSKACMQKYSSPEKEAIRLKKRLILGWCLAIPIIVINYAVPPSSLYDIFVKNFILFLITLPVQFYSGFGFYEGAYHAIRSKTGNMDLLISIGTITAFTFSTFVTFFPGSIPGAAVFFDASAFIITLILTGSFIETLTKSRANRAASKLLSLIPNKTHLISDNGEIIDRKTDEIKKGDKILVKPGEAIPVDGNIFEGESEVDESMLTGEQEPVLRMVNQEVSSGTMNLNGMIKVTVSRTGKDSTVSQIYELIQRAISGRAKIQRISDVFSAVFVPIVIAAALSSGLFWYFYLTSVGYSLSLEIAILAFVSVIVIACPCAIGLAGPITLLISSNQASENGIIIKNTGAMDRLSKLTRAVFDKTGTLTEQDPVIDKIVTVDGVTEDTVISLAASVELSSNHPIARAIVAECDRMHLKPKSASAIKEIPGIGITGEVDGTSVKISRASGSGGSSVSVETDGSKIGYINLSYRVRESAISTIRELKSMGIKTTMITGDSSDEAKRIARVLGIDDIHAEILPQDKAKIVQNYQMAGDYVLFTGDGINDAVALETADVGIAMGTGTDIARESGDLILLNDDLREVVNAIIIGKKTISKIKQNIGWAIGYNAALIPVAGGILVPFFGLSIYAFLPILAAFAMGMSSSSVVINSLFLRRKINRAWNQISNRMVT